MMQQSTIYFEHCRSAELNPHLNVDQRRECWGAWLTHYTTNQPLERTSYAQDRRIALAHGEELDPLPDRMDFVHQHGGGENGERPFESQAPETNEEMTAETHPSANAPPEPAPSDETIVGTDTFRQDPGAPAGRHFAVRRVPPPADTPTRPPPNSNASQACGGVCDPRWDRCLNRCHEFGNQCVQACETQHLRCVRACH